MAYKALYRTYRPKDFDEVAGQEHITKTFKNALMHNKLSHAYLFSGPRGTGKTSIAKIIAKAVNCEMAPVANPCNTCDICKGIEDLTISDVVEIDAASNNGVDEIREIRDKVKYLPGAGRFKVYIIDEVHMLSTGAFNALLKTLEEPPKHVIFILATTEPHKIPATIHSRCQRFDFRGINILDMLEHLEGIVKKENIDIDAEALQIIAESAEGGMRDAISLLDQVVSYSNDTISVDDVHAIKGSISHEAILEIADALYKEEVVEAMNHLEDILAQGKESKRIVEDMILFYRDVLMIKNGAIKEEKLLFKNPQFKRFVEGVSNALVFHYLDLLNETQAQMRYTQQGKLFVELAFIKMIDDGLAKEAKHFASVEGIESQLTILKAQVDTLEEKIQTGQRVEPKEKEEDYDADDVFTFKEESQDEEDTTSLSEEHEFEDEKIKTDEPDNKQSEEPKPKQEEQVEPHEKLFDHYKSKRYTTYDIRFVEDVLNTADREIKIDMVKRWYDIERFVDAKDLKHAKMITDGSLVATNGAMMIIAYDGPTICNRMMHPDIKAKIIPILETYFERKIMYMALPNETWETISAEFVKKFRSKKTPETMITLSPIEHPRLRELPLEKENYQDVANGTVKEATDLFGDIVKVKKGE